MHFRGLLFIAGIFLVFGHYNSMAQTGVIKGTVVDEITQEPIPFANLILENTTLGATTDFDGNFEIKNIAPGIYTIVASVVGYNRYLLSEISVGVAKPVEFAAGRPLLSRPYRTNHYHRPRQGQHARRLAASFRAQTRAPRGRARIQ